MDLKSKLKQILLKYTRLIKFGIVGAINTILNYLVYISLVYVNVNYIIAYATAYLIATTNSYLLNNFWVFKHKSKKHVKKIVKFVFVNLIAMSFGELGLYLFIDILGIHKYIAGLLIIPITAIISYSLYKTLVFKGD